VTPKPSARQVRAALRIRVPRLRALDLLLECLLSVTRNPGRSLLTGIGTVLGAAAFVSTLGIGSTLGRQVADTFDVRRATEVIVRPQAKGGDTAWQQRTGLTRLRGLNGVLAAGNRVSYPEQKILRFPGDATGAVTAQIMAADPGAVQVMHPVMLAGRTYDTFAEDRQVPVVLLPKGLADQLGINRVGVAVFIQDQPFTVAGIFTDVARRPEALLAVVMPYTVGQRRAARYGTATPDVIIETAPGAAQLIGQQAPLALYPQDPKYLQSIAPPDPKTLRRAIEGNITSSSLLVSVIALVVGAFSIGNAATAGIAARTGEVGLRRAVGGRPAHIFLQLLGETTVLGATGGTLGAALGIAVISGVSLWNGWTPTVDLRVAAGASLACAAAGLLAGLLPAGKAMRIQPVVALQR